MKTTFAECRVVCSRVYHGSNIESRETISQRKVSGYYHIIYVREGTCRLYTLSGDTQAVRERFVIDKGSLCYIPAGVPYYTETPEPMYNTNIYFYYSCPSVASHVLPDINSEVLYFGDIREPRLCPIVEITDIPLLGEVFCVNDAFGGQSILHSLTREWDSRYRHSSEIMSCLTARLLLEAVRQMEFQQRPSSREAADRTIAYIAEHYAEKIDCRSVAKALGYHPNYLNTVIRDATGMSLHSYITDTKLRRAVYLVNCTDMRISEIAAELSFGDASHFTNVYTAKIGVAPTKQRRMKQI